MEDINFYLKTKFLWSKSLWSKRGESTNWVVHIPLHKILELELDAEKCLKVVSVVWKLSRTAYVFLSVPFFLFMFLCSSLVHFCCLQRVTINYYYYYLIMRYFFQKLSLNALKCWCLISKFKNVDVIKKYQSKASALLNKTECWESISWFL